MSPLPLDSLPLLDRSFQHGLNEHAEENVLFPNGHSKGPSIVVSSFAMVCVAGFILSLRLYARKKTTGLWWDDHLCIGAWVNILIMACLSVPTTNLGLGRHKADIPQANLVEVNLFGNIIMGSHSLFGMAWSKTAFAFTLWRVTKDDKLVRGFLKFSIVSINSLALGFLTTIFLRCSPTDKAWIEDKEGTCWPDNVYIAGGATATIYSGLLDWAFVAVPWRTLRGIKLRPKEKMAVALSVCLGLLAGASSFVKCSYLPLITRDDYPWLAYDIIFWAIFEITITIVAASIPILRPLLAQIGGKSDTQSKTTTTRASTHVSGKICAVRRATTALSTASDSMGGRLGLSRCKGNRCKSGSEGVPGGANAAGGGDGIYMVPVDIKDCGGQGNGIWAAGECDDHRSVAGDGSGGSGCNSGKEKEGCGAEVVVKVEDLGPRDTDTDGPRTSSVRFERCIGICGANDASSEVGILDDSPSPVDRIGSEKKGEV